MRNSLVKTFKFNAHYHVRVSGTGAAAALTLALDQVPQEAPQVVVDNVHLMLDVAGANGFTWVTGSTTLVINDSGALYEVQYSYAAE